MIMRIPVYSDEFSMDSSKYLDSLMKSASCRIFG